MAIIDKAIKSILFLNLCFSLLACSQNIEGKVTDVFGKGIPGVIVKIDKSKFTATTDTSGIYSLDYAPGNFSIRFLKDDYTTLKVDLNIQQKTKFPAEEVVMYPIPKEYGVYFIGDKELIKMNFNKTVQEYSSQTGGYFAFTWNYRYIVDGQPLGSLPAGKLRFIDTYPSSLALASCNDGLVLSSNINLSNRDDIYNGYLGAKENVIGEEKLIVRTYELPPGTYAFTEVENKMVMGTIPKKQSSACLFSVGNKSIATASNPNTNEYTLKGNVTKNDSGNKSGFVTVKNTNKEEKVLFWHEKALKLEGQFPSVGDSVTVHYTISDNRDTPFVITKIINK